MLKNFSGIDDIALACVYFNYKESASPTDIIANVLKQLLQRTPILSDKVRDLYSSHNQRQTRPNLNELVHFLQDEAGRISSFFIILDALDECTGGENDAAKILLELKKIPNARLLITGRPNAENILRATQGEDFLTLIIRADDRDIRKFLNHQIEVSVFLSLNTKNDQELRDMIIDKIVDNANGMYAHLHRV
jgi:hypothetical protein